MNVIDEAGVDGSVHETVGLTESTVIDCAADLDDVFPITSACTVVINHTPSASDGRVHAEPEVLPDI